MARKKVKCTEFSTGLVQSLRSGVSDGKQPVAQIGIVVPIAQKGKLSLFAYNYARSPVAGESTGTKRTKSFCAEGKNILSCTQKGYEESSY